MRQIEASEPGSTFFVGSKRQYIRAEHKSSLSRQAWLLDKSILWLKMTINSAIHFFNQSLISVKYRYLLGQKILNEKRNNSLKKLEGIIGTRGAPLVKGMLFGDLSGIDRETYHSFKVIGILHVLSASSANFAVFLNFCLFFLKPVFGFFDRRVKFILQFATIAVYFLLVGAVASTTRAFLGLSLAFVASLLLQRAYLSIFNLYITAVLMLSINPIYLGELGFQFSFLASFGIIFLYNFLEKELSIQKNYLFKSILLSFCAQFFLIPIFIYNFAELNYLAILANFLILPLIEILTTLFLVSFVSLFLSNLFHSQLLTFAEYFLSFLISKALYILFFLIDSLEKIPWKSIKFIDNKDEYMVVFTLINLLAITWVFYQRNRRYSKDKYRIFK